MPEVALIKGDATQPWPLPDNHLASIVTDPPYGLKFMGKDWDDKGGPVAYQVWTTLWAKEAFRCLKPGGFLLAFGATRMAHRMTCGFEDAGFDILDGIEWLYLSGMPKAQDIGKLFDKREGAEREVLGERVYAGGHVQHSQAPKFKGTAYNNGQVMAEPPQRMDTAPATDLARQWDGWKTPSLKPAHEPIVVARKPFPGTYCENLEQWGVGAINVDGCRIPGPSWGTHTKGAQDHLDAINLKHGKRPRNYAEGREPIEISMHDAGRFPANVVMSHGPDCTPEACQDGCPVKVLDAQSGPREPGRFPAVKQTIGDGIKFGKAKPLHQEERTLEGGGASKVFAKSCWDQDDYAAFHYCPKASQRDRNEGCEALPNGNDHATVKPTGLIRYLQRLVTPPGGITGSPFLGSGTDAVAAIREGFNFWGMNLPDRPGEEYWPIIEARVAYAQGTQELLAEVAATAPPVPVETVVPAEELKPGDQLRLDFGTT